MSQSQPSQPNQSNPDRASVNYMEAPMVNLIDADPRKMNPTELAAYLTKLREFRGNPATRKAATEQKPKAGTGTSKGLDLGGLL